MTDTMPIGSRPSPTNAIDMKLRASLAYLLVCVSALSMVVVGVSHADTLMTQSHGQLGHGQIGHGRSTSMQWWASAEVTTEAVTHTRGGPSNEVVCITVAILEPTEGNESTTCGPPDGAGIEQVEQSPYGVVAAAMYPRRATRVFICMKGGRGMNVQLRQIHLRAAVGRPTYSYSYFARGFAPSTRIRWITAFDGRGRVVTSGSVHRQCH